MTDLNKLREEFEQLPVIKHAIEKRYVYFEKEFCCYLDIEEIGLAAAFVNGAWCAYQIQQAKFDLYMNDFTIAANCVKSQQKTIDALRAQLDKLESGDYVLVPKEPTSEMLYCGYAVADNLAKKYSAMVAAAQEQNK